MRTIGLASTLNIEPESLCAKFKFPDGFDANSHLSLVILAEEINSP